jgi:hypothetical protein
MAEWKKLVVSGSDISQLNNDAGYLTSVIVQHAFTTASYNGTNLLADSSQGTLNFASSSGEGLTISADAGTDTLTFGLSAIPNSSLANNSVALGDQTLTLGAAATTTLTGITSITATSFTGSLLGTASFASNAGTLNGLSSTSFVLNSQTASMSVLSSSYALNATNATNATNAINALTASNITPAITNGNDNYVLTSNGNGTINGEANLQFNGTTLTLTGNQIISGDLTVNGTTTTLNTDNLLVEDKFILLASGSTSSTDGGIIIQSAAAGTGFAFMYDSAQARWGYTGSLAHNATTAAPDAFAAMVLDLQNGSSDIAAYQKNGNIKIDTGDIYIYA